MAYQNRRSKIMEFIEGKIVPFVEKGYDIDKEKLIALLMVEIGASKKMTIECIEAISKMGLLKIQDDGVITIPDEKISGSLRLMRINEKMAKKEAEGIIKNQGEIKQDGNRDN